jgi:hypothetical protein
MGDIPMARKPQSQVKKKGFVNFMSGLFGWRSNQSKSQNLSGIEFTRVDLDSNQRLIQALANDALRSGKLSDKVGELFNFWLSDNNDTITELSERKSRVDQLTYAVLNDPYVGRAVQLYADESTQLDIQDRIISIESPDPRQTKRMYELLNSWGVTQQRTRAALEQLATYGDAFWANKVGDRGVERIIPLKQLQVSTRLEFNPVQALEIKKRKEGNFAAFLNKSSLINSMLDDLDNTDDFADMFDTKLFGFVVENDTVVPPWNVTHFRVNPDSSEFYPYGKSPILGTLAPFKLTSSTITLQSIARILSLPVTLYKVKTGEGADEGRQFQIVNKVREAYDNIGVNVSSSNSEVYSNNTKIWLPDGLLDIDIKDPKVDIGFTNDIELYQDRTAIASGVPKSYMDQEWGGFGNSAISLVQQYKPFARACYTIQSAYLEGLADLFRLHFAITGEFDYRTPFTLSLKYPAEEVSDDKNKARAASLDMAKDVIDMVRAAIGAEEEESLPPDVVRDILGKYSFLSPEDIVKWTKAASRSSLTPSEGSSSFRGRGDSFDLVDLGDDEGIDLDDDEDIDLGEDVDIDLGEEGGESSEESPIEESEEQKSRLTEARIRELAVNYQESKDEVYFKVLRENSINEFVRRSEHVAAFTTIRSCSESYLETLSKNRTNPKKRMKETTLEDMMEEVKQEVSTN